jgi:hypothetical protein
VVPKMRPDELGIELAGMHGGMVALAYGGRWEQATVVAKKARASSARWRRTQKREKGGEKGSRGAPATRGPCLVAMALWRRKRPIGLYLSTTVAARMSKRWSGGRRSVLLEQSENGTRWRGHDAGG